uniref:Global nitrogen transcriptional regulator n=1 Tax=Polysiphonia sertularioides TaxID=945028 RepID=A0A1Z1M9X6_9FLOR|nr:global nitrogen transcriptional regulator [Polysiphonia sertularioides]ARW62575.1 global nitrogen transcriptional regulator [Polysiphonia sertularioides]
MNWIMFFSINTIPYRIYKLKEEDSIVLKSKSNNNIAIILEGIILLVKNFHNKESLPIAVLGGNHIIEQTKTNRSYYQIIALKETYIIITTKSFLYSNKIKKHYLICILDYYRKTLTEYEKTIEIINQKNIKKRIVLLMLSLFLKFGVFNKSKLTISFTASTKFIAKMIGTKESTVIKILKSVDYINIEKGKKKQIYFINTKNFKLI